MVLLMFFYKSLNVNCNIPEAIMGIGDENLEEVQEKNVKEDHNFHKNKINRPIRIN